jgi:hypothetical protein
MSNLPKRVPGALLPSAGPAPDGGWFGTDVAWPTDDPDATAIRYMCGHGLIDGTEAEALFHRVLDGLHRLDGARPADNASHPTTVHSGQ